MKISIIIPTLNEEDNIEPIYTAVGGVISDAGYLYEIIFSDGNSTDKTGDIVSRLADSDPNVKLISTSRNFGHMAALIAGYAHCSGDAAITMDCDLQHPPEIIPVLISKWKEGYNIVNTKRMDTISQGIFKKYSSKFFYKIFSWLSDFPIEEGSADYRLVDRKVIDQINSIEETDIFLRGMIYWIGFRSTSVPYTPNKRLSGNTKYNLRKMMHFALSGITSFSTKPLKMVTYAGFIISGFTFAYFVYTIYYAINYKIEVSGWTSLILSVLFLGGIQLISLGILGEYIGKIFMETKKRPRYIINNKKGF
jgi:polyisoprenyl-phosphate glycosyltransferase